MKKFLFSVTIFFLMLMSAHAQVPTTGLIGFWPFEGNADEYYFDYFGNVDGASLTDDRFGSPNSAYYFDGINDFILCGESLYLTNKVSVGCWVNFTDEIGTMLFLARYGSLEDHGFMLGKIASGQVFFAGRDENNVYITTPYTENSLADGQWHFIMGVCDVTVWSLWVDGVLIGSDTTDHTTVDIQTTSHPLCFGKEYGSNSLHYQGYLDDVRIYNRALSENEIQEIYQDSTTGLADHRKEICKIYPNPASSELKFADINPERVVIFNAQGQIVHSSIVDKNTRIVDISMLPSGLYLIEAFEGNEVYTQKFTKL